jgi:hypothetical protein
LVAGGNPFEFEASTVQRPQTKHDEIVASTTDAKSQIQIKEELFAGAGGITSIDFLSKQDVTTSGAIPGTEDGEASLEGGVLEKGNQEEKKEHQEKKKAHKEKKQKKQKKDRKVSKDVEQASSRSKDFSSEPPFDRGDSQSEFLDVSAFDNQ